MLFIIGNGFDLAMGLKTSYRDFVNWYITQKEEPEDERISKFKNNIQSDIETSINSWADLEIKLGEYTLQYKEDEIDDFLFVYRDMKEKLNEYIKHQESLVDLSNEDAIKKEWPQFLLGFYNRFPTNTKALLQKALEGHAGVIKYNFVTYNYTHTLENCLKLLPVPLRKRGSYEDKINQILHMHGEIDKSPLIGVDSDEQIQNEAFKSDVSVLRALVKPQMNEEMQENTAQKALDLINGSNIICLFGVSLGDSDISWWRKLGEWLKKSAERKLIIFWYSSEPLSSLHYDIRLTREDNVKKHFLKKAGFADADFTQISNRIIVHIYTDIFKMKLIPEETL